MTRGYQSFYRLREILFLHQHVIGIERGDRENADAGGSQRRRDRG